MKGCRCLAKSIGGLGFFFFKAGQQKKVRISALPGLKMADLVQDVQRAQREVRLTRLLDSWVLGFFRVIL